MQYHLDTIPVWNAMEEQAECPVCALLKKAEDMEIERSLGGSVMEPAVRIQVNERGFCGRHQERLFQQKNRLGHALLVDSHAKELLKKVERLSRLAQGKEGGLKALFGGGAADAPIDRLMEGLVQLTQPCAVCEAVAAHMDRYLYTFLHLWKTEPRFKAAWAESKGACIPHTAELLARAKKHLSPAQQKEFAASLMALLQNSLAENEKDLEWFTQKFDYRNQEKPWGNSKNALERMVNRLRGRCL